MSGRMANYLIDFQWAETILPRGLLRINMKWRTLTLPFINV